MSNGETSMALIRHSASPFGVTFFQVAPPSRVNWTRPSSLPVQITPFSWGDSDHVGQRAIVLGADPFVRVGDAGRALLLLLVSREVGRDFLPRPAHVGGLQQDLGAVVERVRLVPAPDDGRVPVEAVLHVLGVHAEVLNRRRHDVRAGRRLRIDHLDRALVAAAQHVARVVGVEGQERALSAGRRLPARRGDAPAAQFAARDDDRRVVLLPAVDAVRETGCRR